MIKLEEAKYASICGFVLAHKELFMDSGIFDLGLFWAGQKSVLPVHYSLWLAEVGCAKVVSNNVEVMFSGVVRISMKSHCLNPQLLSDYAFLHYNYKYDWLRPKLEEIVATVLHQGSRKRTKARSAPGQDTRSGQGALARRHTDGPLWAALLKTTVMCKAWRDALRSTSSDPSRPLLHCSAKTQFFL